ncbi:ribonucleoside triphosphate reductase [Candidatus Acetothermia bacterium]|nr:ribonucleoside triphosphate reductase [Candidatus Acetothermia bacterium]
MTLEKIVKRDGRIVAFDESKITTAIWKAMRSLDKPDATLAKELTDQVTAILTRRFVHELPTVEGVQDIVEEVLLDGQHHQLAKAYILYRKQRTDAREVKDLLGNLSVVEDYINNVDWRVRENSNMTYSLQGLNVNITDKVISKYWLNTIYSREVKVAHERGDFHLHDLGTLGAYCVGWDLQDLLVQGFRGVRGKIESRAAKHFRVALLQVANFLYTLQGETAGAQAFSNVDTYLAPFIRFDNLSYHEVKQHMQEFIYNLNVPTRVGFQTPFTNITLDLKVPKYMEATPVIIGGKVQKEVYGDFQHEMDMFNRAFAEVMTEGDLRSRPFTFPIPTYNITEEFDWDNKNLDAIWEMTSRYGIPYFANFIGSDMKPEDARSMCCRLRIDNRELNKRGGGLFGANPLTGSIGVVTINMPRLGFLADSTADFFDRLSDLMVLAKESLLTKRKVLEQLTDKGLYPYSKFYLQKIKDFSGEYWKNHFSTIGLIGMNDALLNLFGEDITTPHSHAFAIEVLNFMRSKLAEFQAESREIFNLEATPAEGASYRLARNDLSRFPDIRISNLERSREGEPYYTNSTHLPVSFTPDIFAALNLQDQLQSLYTGGTVFHGFLGESLPSIHATKNLVRKIAENYHLPYYTITPTFSICVEHGYFTGENARCPVCNGACEVYSRVVGYLRPVEQWNNGKRAEFADRKVFFFATPEETADQESLKEQLSSAVKA